MLVAGWLLAVPVPVLIILAPTWGSVVAADVLLGVSQGLTRSTTVIMKIVLAGPARCGTAMGVNDAAGYLARRRDLPGHRIPRPDPGPGTGAIPARAGSPLSGWGSRRQPSGKRGGHAWLEADDRHAEHAAVGTAPRGVPTDREVFARTSLRDPTSSAASQAGLVNNLSVGLAWDLLPVLFTTAGLTASRIGVLVAPYGAVWGLG